MKTYDIYKPTKIEFLDAIPEHWKEKRLRFLGYLYGGLTGKSANDFNQPDNEENRCFIPFTNIAGNLKINPDQLQNVIIKDGERQNEVRNGDLFFLMSSEDFDDVGKSAVLTEEIPETYLNSFCKGLRITSQEINSEYLNYHLHSKQLRHNLLTEANGFTRINLKVGKVQDLFVAYPKKSEQTAIASYLDHKTAQIDELIADKKRLLELYEEEKTAIINQAVTKGINPDVPIKDSGIEWLGEIPEHWEIKRLKYVASINDEVLTEKAEDDLEIEYVEISGVKSGIGIVETSNYFFKDAPSRARRVVRDGDVLVSTVRTYLKSIAKVDNPPDNLIASTGFAVIRPRKIDSDFTGFLFYSEPLIGEIISLSTGVSYPAINASQIGDISIPIPSIEEQHSIVHHIETECKRIDTQVERTKKLIELLNEYREALISEVVTGQIKVID
jgi:type I restriction enzyme S subunit